MLVLHRKMLTHVVAFVVLSLVGVLFFWSEAYAAESAGDIITKTSAGIKAGSGTIYGPIDALYNFFVVTIFLTLGTTALSLAGEVFNYLLWFTLDTNILGAPFVENAWATFRDMANLSFILMLIYISFTLISGVQEKVGKELFVKLILIGLILNFSLLVSQIIIDAGNIAGLAFYNSITITAGEGAQAVATGEAKNVSGAILRLVNPVRLIGDDVFNSLATTANGAKWGQLFATSLAYFIICIMLALSLFKAGFFFISRTAWLIILMVISPLMFVGMFLPKGNYFQWWFATILERSFCVCIYLFFLFILVTVGGNIPDLINVKAQPGTDGWISLLLVVAISFAVIYTILHLAERETKKFCEGDIGVGSKVFAMTVGAATGATGLAARSSLGFAGQALRNSQGLGKLAASKNVFAKTAGLSSLALGEKLYGGNFGLKDSYKTKLEQSAKDENTRAERLTTLTKPGLQRKEEDRLKEERASRGTELQTKSLDSNKTYQDLKKVAELGGGAGHSARAQMELIEKEAARTAEAEALRVHGDDKTIAALAGKKATEESRNVGKAYLKANTLGTGKIIDWVRAGGVAGASEEGLDTFEKKEKSDADSAKKRQENIAIQSRLGSQTGLIEQALSNQTDTFVSKIGDQEFGTVWNEDFLDDYMQAFGRTFSAFIPNANGTFDEQKVKTGTPEFEAGKSAREELKGRLSTVFTRYNSAFEKLQGDNNLTTKEFKIEESKLRDKREKEITKAVQNNNRVGLTQLKSQRDTARTLAGAVEEARLDEAAIAKDDAGENLSTDLDPFKQDSSVG